jgi:fatty-acyl-CoA synthase
MNHSTLGQMRVGDVLDAAALRFPNREALFCTATGRRLSFAQLHERVNRLANALLGLGLRKGECVAFLSTNRAEVPEIYLALAKSGLVGMPLNYRLAPVEMVELMKEVGAVALVCERRFAAVAAQARQALPALREAVGFGEGEAAGLRDYESLLAQASAAAPVVEVGEHDPFYFNLTSGTTGLPKCYLISHYCANSFFPMFHSHHMRFDDVILTVFPMYGRVGFAWAMAGLMWGCRNVLMNFDPAEALRLMARERVTITNLVPTMAAMLLARPELDATDLSSLRGVVFAGSLLPAPVREGVMARLCRHLYEYYGMQETSTLVVSTPEDRARRPDSVGVPIPFAQVRIVDTEGRDLPPGQTGAVIGRSPGTVTSYFNNPEKTAETFRDGWLHTGDLGRLDEQGYLYISGRLKDVIITGGQNVHAGEVEETILGLAGVSDCAVVGLSDPLWGEAVTAVVVPAEGQSVEAEAVIAWCRQSLAGFKTPKRVLIQADPLPRTPTGKVQKFRLVERYDTDTDTNTKA